MNATDRAQLREFLAEVRGFIALPFPAPDQDYQQYQDDRNNRASYLVGVLGGRLAQADEGEGGLDTMTTSLRSLAADYPIRYRPETEAEAAERERRVSEWQATTTTAEKGAA